ncbi:MAG TPA: D-glycero-beta-D-manno-heptose-7-phosphate kinase [Candidatus Binatia bacterium]|nr:D-glycero-beta-D-manno-heptose-7-phosphate kinase [Candidatus Binatia bacterium]
MQIGRRSLRALVRRLAGVRVLVVGDLMLDQFIWGEVERISPEAPVPVVRVTADDVRPGGAGNVVSNVAALGGRVAACGVVGGDAAGRRLVAALGALGASTEGIVTAPGGETTQKTRIIARHQQVVRFDRDVPAADGAAGRRLRDFVLRQRRAADVLVVSDYGKGAIDGEILAALAEAHRRAPFTWLVDPKRANFAHYRRPTLVKPNREEAAAAAGIDITDTASLHAAGRRLLERWEAGAVLVSRGEGGLALFKPGGMVEEFPTAAREVFDVTGAGDTVMAALALALGAGGSLEEATVLANYAAGVVVGKLGTATVSATELLAAVGGADEAGARPRRARRAG